MNHLYRILLLLLCGPISAFAQPDIEWATRIGGSGHDLFRSFVKTSDGGYFMGGNSSSNISGDKSQNAFNGFDYWVIKLDSNRNIEWQHTLGGVTVLIDFEQEYLTGVIQTLDDGYMVSGWSGSPVSGNKTAAHQGLDDYWIVKLNASGVVEWQQSYGGNNNDMLIAIQQTVDGGYIMGGASGSDISGDKTENSRGSFDYWVLKVDAVGVIEWQKTIGGDGYDQMNDLIITPDGGYLLAGRSNSGISGEKTEMGYGSNDYWIIKLNVSGDIEWQRTIGGSNSDNLITIIPTQDGGYCAGGASLSGISGLKTEESRGGQDFWIVKLDPVGNITWQKTIGGSGSDSLNSYSLLQSFDGSYMISGSSDSNISGEKTQNSEGGFDLWAVKLSSTGTIQWQKTIGGTDSDGSNSVLQDTDGGFILGGSFISPVVGGITEAPRGLSDYMIIKLEPESLATHDIANVNQIMVYPNPVTNVITVNFGTQSNATITITNILGQQISQQSFTAVELATIPLTGASGIYFVAVADAGGQKKVFKIIKE